MDEFYERMSEVGQKLGLSGQKLIDFVEDKYEQQKAVDERETRLRERNLEKEIAETELERERLKLSAAKGVTSSHSHTDIRAKVPKLPPFDDSQENIEDYLQRFERYAVSVGWNPADRALHLSALLKGKALAVYSRLSPEQAKDYDTLKEALYKRFQLSEEAFRKRFRNSVPDSGETPSQFAARIEHYILRWIELGKVDMTFKGLLDLNVREQFLNSCGKNLSMFLREKKLTSVKEVITQAELYVEAHGKGEFGGRRYYRQGSGEADPANRSAETVLKDGQKCYGCGKTDHKIKDCKLVKCASALMENMENAGNNPSQTRGGYQSGNRGYSSRGRGRSRGGQRGRGPYRKSDDKDSEAEPKVGCCVSSSRQSLDSEDNLEDKLPVMSVAYKPPIRDVTKFNRMPTAEGFIGQVKVTVLRDTGCSGVIVRRDLVSAHELTGKVQQCVLVDGTVRKFPKALIEVRSPYFSGKTEALCVERPVYPLIIGNIPGLEETTCHIDNGKEVRTVTQEKSNECPVGESVKTLEGKIEEKTDVKGTTEDLHANAVQTRAQVQKEKQSKPKGLKVPSPIAEVSRDEIKDAQGVDETLKNLWGLAESGEKKQTGKYNLSWYEVHKGLLYRRFQSPKHEKGSVLKQLVVPKAYRESVMKLGHESLMSGHLGYQKTLDKVSNQFHWPGILSDLKRYCRSCGVCQRTFPKGKVTKAPLGDMPLVDTPFQRVAVDLIGPISPPSERGHRYILTVVDYATRYPEAVSLKTIETEAVAEALVQIFCRVGIPREILSDQGTQFLSGLMAEVSRLLSMKQLVTTPYHPSCNGLVEKMNGTLKAMVKKMCSERPKDWDRYITPALFAYREAPQASTGFSPFELLYGWKVRGPLEILRQVWTKEIDDDEVKTVYQYVLDLRERLEETLGLAHRELAKSKEKYKTQYNKKSRLKDVKVGDKVLILLPTKSNKLLMQWQGPFPVTKRVGDLDYQIEVRGKVKTFHANMLKKFFEREPPETGIIANVCAAVIEEESCEVEERSEADLNTEGLVLPSLVRKESVEDVKLGTELNEAQLAELKDLLDEYEDILTDVPGKTNLAEHEIRLTTDEPIRTRQYPLPFAMKDTIKKEVESMLKMDIIEPSDSPYSSPIVLILKPDKTYRFCVDLRKINQATVFDSEPMPNPEEIISRLSKCKYFSKVDLSKGYWQIPMSESSKQVTAFTTTSGLWQFKRMAFGLVTAPSTFSRMMRKLLKGLKDLDNFLDDILIFTVSWQDHLRALRALFDRIRSACLTARPSKCLFGFGDLEFLGHNVGQGLLKPVCDKLHSIANAPRPKTKKELRSFLGLVGFYRKFVANFACKAVPLTDLTRKNQPNQLRWEEAHDLAFQALKQALTKSPILRLPDLDKTFILRTDAAQFGIGAVLLQEWPDGKFPLSYASRKLLPREVNYSVIEKECLAIVWGVQKFRQYLYGVEFVLETDHAPLLYLNKSKDSNSRIMRWALILQSYRFRIIAIKGSENVGADFLSRVVAPEEAV